MAYFARKIDYVANAYSFVALVEIARKRGGEPIKLVLYRYGFRSFSRGQIFEMIEFAPDKGEEAKKSFPYGPIVYDDSMIVNEFGDQAYFDRKEVKNLWRKTTDWLYEVAAGGAYQIYPKGTWVKIGRERRWKDRRKRRIKVLRFGELGHIYMINEKELERLESMVSEISGDELTEEMSEDMCDKMQEIENQIRQIEDKLTGLREEMKYVRKKRARK